MKKVRVEELRVGDHIRLDKDWMNHPFFRNRFRIRDRAQIEKLRQAGVEAVEWISGERDPKPGPVREEATGLVQEEDRGEETEEEHMSPELSDRDGPGSLTILEKAGLDLIRGEKRYEESLQRVRMIMKGFSRVSREVVEESNHLIRDILGTILSDKEVTLQLINMKKQEEAFYHVLNVAILSLLLGRECGLNEQLLRALGHGAIFHDIGKERISERTLKKMQPLSAQERQILRLHPKYGEEMASRIETFPSDSLYVLRQHHESCDGMGYPDGRRGDEISPLAMITSIVNVYDNLCNRNRGELSLTPHEACSYMYSNMRGKFPQEPLALFIRCIGVYPPGTLVRLNGGSIGLVISVNEENALRPDLLVCDPDSPEAGTSILRLEEELEISIEKGLRPESLDAEVIRSLNPRGWSLPGMKEMCVENLERFPVSEKIKGRNP